MNRMEFRRNTSVLYFLKGHRLILDSLVPDANNLGVRLTSIMMLTYS